MNEERLKAYRNLIQKLLSCPSGEESEILNAHQDLLDAGLVQAMLQVAEMLTKEGDQNNADFLRDVARQLAEAMENSPSNQLNFLKQVLKATSDGNGDSQIVYPLLQQNLDLLNDNLAQVLQNWATATLAEVEPEQAQGIAGVIGNFSNLIKDFPLGSRASNLETAITGYEVIATVFTRDAFPVQWAATQNNLGAAYSDRIREERAENLEKAIAAFTAALSVYTRDAFPVQWAATQNNLGNAYSDRIREERAENLEKAIAAFTAALSVRTRDALPVDWATTQNNLGNAYGDRIRGERAENLEAAIAAYTAALSVRTGDALPQNHAETQFNLGRAYQDARQFTKAKTTFTAAIETVEFLRGEIIFGSGREGDKQKLAEEYNRIYQGMAQVCLELGENDQAIEYVEQSKTRNLVELLATKHLYPKEELYANPNAYQTHCQQLDQLRRAIPSQQRQLQILMGSRESEEKYGDEIEQQRQHLHDLRQQRNSLLQEINQIDSSFKFTQQVEPIPFREIQALTNEHAAIVEWYIFNDCFRTFIIIHSTEQDSPGETPGGDGRKQPIVWSSTSEDLSKLENWGNEYLRRYYESQQAYAEFKAVERGYKRAKTAAEKQQLQQELESKQQEWEEIQRQWEAGMGELLQQLAEILHLQDILHILDQTSETIDQLILIPHRYLHLFPLHALPLPDQEDKCLLDKFKRGVRYAPSCQLLQLSQMQQRTDFSRLFAIQNPTEDLIYTDLEVEAICSFFPEPKPEVLASRNASETYLKSNQNFPLAHCTHFSCHGYFNPTSPLESSILLAESQSSEEAKKKGLEDGYLTLAEIFGLSLDQCRLVTLSACETGMTEFTRTSDEYIGLPSGFIFAGSPSVVSSLWIVNQFSTAFLMIKFYENLKESLTQNPTLETGNVAVALNQAQIWLRDVNKEQLEVWTMKLPLDRTWKRHLRRQFFGKMDANSKPFQETFHWAGFCAIGK